MLQLAAMKNAILTGMAHEQSGINLWHMDYVCSSVMASPVLLFLHRDALNGTVLEKPEYLPGHNFEVYAGRRRTPKEDWIMLADDLAHYRIDL